MPQPLVSIVITNHNYGRFINEAVQSIVDQHYPELELIIVDDASTDDSKTVIEQLSNLHNQRFQRFVTKYLPTNRDINGALNVAIPEASGEITIIFDADDILEPQHIQTLVTALLQESAKNPQAAFAYCDCLIVDEGNQPIQRGLAKPFDADLIKTESFLPRPSPIFTTVLKSCFPLPENKDEDPKHYLWKKICKQDYIGIYVPEPLFRYRIHSNNYSSIGQKIRAAQLLGMTNTPLQLSEYWPHSPQPNL